MDINKHSPLTESMFYILLALKEPLHGYGIIKKVENFTKERVTLAAGTLYGALTNLEKHKLIESAGIDPENKRRKLYIITEHGVKLLEHESGRMFEMLSNIRRLYDF